MQRDHLGSAAGRALRLTFALVVAGLCVTAAASAAAKPKCVGAAARDAKNPCFNPTRSVTPSLKKADDVTASPCKLTDEQPEPVCTFGAARSRASRQIALVGDSHALQWRSALDFVAKRQGWHGYSLTIPGCPFSDARRYLPEDFRAFCEPWYRGVQKWFRRHPEVTTMYTSQYAPLELEIPAGKTELEIKSAGFRRAWGALPKTVKRVIAIHDTPKTTETTAACLRDAIAAGTQRPGIACKVARRDAVLKDATVAAARQPRSRRYAFVDLTSFFCGRAYCYPVIGGVLVYRDHVGHITIAYAESLAPYLLRRLRFLGEVRRRGARTARAR